MHRRVKWRVLVLVHLQNCRRMWHFEFKKNVQGNPKYSFQVHNCVLVLIGVKVFIFTTQMDKVKWKTSFDLYIYVS